MGTRLANAIVGYYQPPLVHVKLDFLDKLNVVSTYVHIELMESEVETPENLTHFLR